MKKVSNTMCGLLACVLLAGCWGKGPGMEKKAEETADAVPVNVTEVTVMMKEIPAETVKKMAEHLQKAYAREYAAAVRYDAWGENAEKDGWKHAASLFRAIAKSEAVHAERHAQALKALGETPVANVEVPEGGPVNELMKKAADAEKETVSVFYPEVIREMEIIVPEKAKGMIQDCRSALENDEQHILLFEAALQDAEKEKASENPVSVCTVCGFITEGAPPASCPHCGAPAEKFEKK